jgi:hypothetical protein
MDLPILRPAFSMRLIVALKKLWPPDRPWASASPVERQSMAAARMETNVFIAQLNDWEWERVPQM